MISKEDFDYLNRARGISAFSLDPGTKIGAVLTREYDGGRLITGVGHNQLAPGIPSSMMSDRDFKIASVIHAEEIAIKLEHTKWFPMLGTMYVWGIQSCAHCVAVGLLANINRFVSVRVKEDRDEWNKQEIYSRRQCEAVGAIYDSYSIFDWEKTEEVYASKNKK